MRSRETRLRTGFPRKILPAAKSGKDFGRGGRGASLAGLLNFEMIKCGFGLQHVRRTSRPSPETPRIRRTGSPSYEKGLACRATFSTGRHSSDIARITASWPNVLPPHLNPCVSNHPLSSVLPECVSRRIEGGNLAREWGIFKDWWRKAGELQLTRPMRWIRISHPAVSLRAGVRGGACREWWV